ncbi:sugar glycosyltransferase [Buttiauxella gaviniae]|uniref:Sugar glycosyltransferase n=1 Tax=Buttiauxella gaviniae TaxID=82990 RepID=A0ABV3NTZ8_9ENTR
MGTLTKQIYRYTHPRSMRHNENLWPFVKIQRDKNNAISHLNYRGENVPLVDLTSLKENFKGEVLLTATGPSIKKIDFSTVPSMPTVGVNGAWHLNSDLDFKFYIIVDMIFVDNKPDIIEEIIKKEDLVLFTTMHGIVRIIDKFTLNKVKCKLAVIEDKCYPIYEKKISNADIYNNFNTHKGIIFSKENINIAFNHDIRNGIFDAGTVIYWSLQILSYLGFKKIYVVGLDMTNFSTPRFYETKNDMLPSFLAEKLQEIIIPAFSLASLELKKDGVDVVNLSLESAIPSHIFPKMDYRDAFK